MQEPLRQILAAYGAELRESAWSLLSLAAAGPLLFLIGRRLRSAQLRIGLRLLAGLAVTTGIVLCFQRASAFDDAFISFRYAQNLVEGRGLVFNPGERVEGYTNFLWTVLLAAVYAATRVELPLLGVALSFASYLANLAVVYGISRRLTPNGHVWLPLAVGLLAVQGTFTSYGTTGLETQLASLCVNFGVLHLLREPSIGSRATSGLALILGTLAHPDHAIFYAAGAAVVAWQSFRAARGARPESLRRWASTMLPAVAAYASPFSLYLAHMAFRVAYYDELLPNTYYAKLAHEPYYSQGLIYAADFYLASHMWLLLPLWLWHVIHGPAQALAFRLFSAIAVPIYSVYVVRVGGDFMHGRFFLVLLPFYLLGAEQALHMLLSRRRVGWAVAGGSLMLATAFGVRLQGEREIRWHIADETTYYRITSWFPIVVDHYNYNVGHVLQRMAAAGVAPTVATTSVGMVGYYSGLVVIDKYGLTDRAIARMPSEGRSRPGHERRRVRRYLRERDVHIARHERPGRAYRHLLRIGLGENTGGRHWYWLHYDHELAQAMRVAAPEVRFIDLRGYIERYVERLERGHAIEPQRLARDLDFFEYHFFAEGQAPELRQRLLTAAAAARPTP